MSEQWHDTAAHVRAGAIGQYAPGCARCDQREPNVRLTKFLLARIAEDEAAARAIPPGAFDDAVSATHRYDHIARHDPARVLAECEAKRRIVGLCQHGDWSDPDFHSLGEPDERGDVLALLALPYRDHPDYDPAWAPTA